MVNIDLFRMCTRNACVDNHNVPMVYVSCGHLLVWQMCSMGFFNFIPSLIFTSHKRQWGTGHIHSQVNGANTGNFVSFSNDALGKHSKMIKECE